MLLSRVFLHATYRPLQYLGVFISMGGMGAIIAADVITHRNGDDSGEMPDH